MTEKRFGKRSSGPPERRRSTRDPLEIAVSLVSVGQSRVVLMKDVSPTGARFSGHDLPAVGKDVMLIADDVELFGTVVRSSEAEAAIHFDRPIGLREFEALQAVLAEQAQMMTIQDR